MQIHRPSPFTAPLRGPTTAADTRVVVFNTGYGGGYAYDDGGDVVSDESRAHFSGVVALRAMVRPHSSYASLWLGLVLPLC